jgi:hypothetical protein
VNRDAARSLIPSSAPLSADIRISWLAAVNKAVNTFSFDPKATCASFSVRVSEIRAKASLTSFCARES